MKSTSFKLGLALGAVIALVGGSAANAAPTPYTHATSFDFGANSWTWGIYTHNTSNWRLRDDQPSSAWFTAHPQAGGQNNTWQGRASLAVSDGVSTFDDYINSADGGSTWGDCTQDTNGSDLTIECADQEINGLTVHPEVYYYADHDLTRVIWVITNAGATEVSTDVDLYYGSECDQNGNVAGSNGDEGDGVTGDAAFTLTDWNWMVQSAMDATPDDCAVEGSVWQVSNPVVGASDVNMGGNFQTTDLTFPVTVAPGATIALASFYVDGWIDDGNVATNVNNPTNPFVVSRAAVIASTKDFITTNLSSWSALASRGVAADLNVVNFAPAAGGGSGGSGDSSSSALPNTGVNAGTEAGAAGFAAGLLAVGAIVLVAIRRRANS